MKKFFRLLPALLVLLVTITCSNERDGTDIHFVIGVAQANLSEPWREVMNAEILEAARTFPGVRIVFTNAGNRWEKQEEDIRKLMQAGIDLLIVSPVESREIAAAIREAHSRMPVVVLDKAIEGYDYSLFIGADNHLVGKQAARFVKQYIGAGAGKVIEITGSAEIGRAHV